MEKIICVKLDAYCDSGTGWTAEQQSAWLREAKRKIMSIPANHRLPFPTIVGYDETNREVMFYAAYSLPRDDLPTSGWTTDADREFAAKTVAAVADAEETIRAEVERVMGRHAAYCTVRTYRGEWPNDLKEVSAAIFNTRWGQITLTAPRR